MQPLIIYPQKKEDLKALKAFLKALNIKYEPTIYSPEFVAKMKRGEKDIEQGNLQTIALDEIWK